MKTNILTKKKIMKEIESRKKIIKKNLKLGNNSYKKILMVFMMEILNKHIKLRLTGLMNIFIQIQLRNISHINIPLSFYMDLRVQWQVAGLMSFCSSRDMNSLRRIVELYFLLRQIGRCHYIKASKCRVGSIFKNWIPNIQSD